MTLSLLKSGQNQVQVSKTIGRTSLQSVPANERAILAKVYSVEDVLALRQSFANITLLRLESPELADAFVVNNFGYIASVLNIELNQNQKNDLLDEIGQVGWFTMADAKLFLDRMKRHKFYRRDYQELIDEFWKYCDERLECAFQQEAGKVDSTDGFERSSEIRKAADIGLMKFSAEYKNKNTSIESL